MSVDIPESIKSILKGINSVSFLHVLDDNGQTVLFIPAWLVAVMITAFIFVRRARHAK